MTIVSNQKYSVKKKAKKKFIRSHVIPTHKNSFPLSKNNTAYSLELDSKEAIQVIKYPNELIKVMRPCFVVLDRMELKNSHYFKYVENARNFDSENSSKLSKTYNIKRNESQIDLKSSIADNSVNRTLEKVESCQIKSKETSNCLLTEIDPNILKHCLVLKNEYSCGFLNMSNSSESALCLGNISTNNKTSAKTARICNMKHCRKSYDSCQLPSEKKSLQTINIKYSTKEVDIWSESAKTIKPDKTAFVLCDNKSEYKNLNSIIKPCSVILTKIHFNGKNNTNLDFNVRSDDFIGDSKSISPVKKMSSDTNVRLKSDNYFCQMSANLAHNTYCSNKDSTFNFNEEDKKFELQSKFEFTGKTDNKLVTHWLSTFGKTNGKDLDKKDSKLAVYEEKENLIRPCSVILKNCNSKNSILSQNDALSLQFTDRHSEKNIKLNEITNLTENSGESNQLTYSCITKHICDLCGKILLNVKALYYHLCHGKKKRGFFCMLCEKTFDFYRLFEKHKCPCKTQTILSCSKLLKHRRTVKYGKSNEALKIVPSSNQFSKNDSDVTRALSGKTSKPLGNLSWKENRCSVSGMRRKSLAIKSIFVKDISCASTSKY